MITLTRSLRLLERQHGVTLRVSYGKVAEYHRRGGVHFQALSASTVLIATNQRRFSRHRRPSLGPISPSWSPTP